MRPTLTGSFLAVAVVILSVPTGSHAASPVAPKQQHYNAVAASGWDRCQHGETCLFEHANGEGEMFIITDYVDPYMHDFNDKASSIWNRGRDYFCAFKDADYGGGPADIYERYGPPTNISEESNDTLTSYRLC